MALHVKNGASWVEPSKVHVRTGGVWVEPKKVHVRTGGVWEEVYPGFPPPTLQHDVVLAVVSGKNSQEIYSERIWTSNTSLPTWMDWGTRTRPPSSRDFVVGLSTDLNRNISIANAGFVWGVIFSTMDGNGFLFGAQEAPFNSAIQAINPLAYIELYKTTTVSAANLLETWNFNSDRAPTINPGDASIYFGGNKTEIDGDGFENDPNFTPDTRTGNRYRIRIFA